MTAKLATQSEYILARAEEARTTLDGNAISGGVSEKPRAGSMQLDCGYLSPYFITDPERMEVAFDNAYILIHGEKISSRKALLPLLEQIASTGRPLLIIAEGVADEVLAALVVNKLRGPLQVAAVTVPGLRDQCKGLLHDIALLTGGRAVTGDLDIQLKDVQMSDLGQATKITIHKHHTVLQGGAKYDSPLSPNLLH
jgi:chaperonin GroEL